MAQYSYSTLQPEYKALWDKMIVTKLTETNKQAGKVCSPANKARYQTVEKMTGMPWFCVGCLHMRESNGNFNTWLHNGDPMRRDGKPVRTVNVPKGRPTDPNISWEAGAADAIIGEQLHNVKDWGPERVAYAAEKFNGFGYRNPNKNIPSPYLWAGTNIQKPGKYISDGVYATVDPKTGKPLYDEQIGAMALLRQIMAMDPTAKFDIDAAPPLVPTDAPIQPEPTPASPKADDTVSQVKPLEKSKTIWGGIITWLSGISAAVMGSFQYIATPWGFAALVFIVGALSLGLYLVIKGRIDVNNIIKHLSQDDSDG
jgi:lysozyme family protein